MEECYTQTIPPENYISFTSDKAIQTLFTCLSVENIIYLFKCIILEQRIFIHSKNIEKLSLCSEGLLSLIYPFVWVNPYISLLPISLIQCLEVPTPIIIGMHSCFLGTEIGYSSTEDGVLVYLDNDQVYTPELIKKDIPPMPAVTETQLLSNIRPLSLSSTCILI